MQDITDGVPKEGVKSENDVSTDILVIGLGGAGCRTTIEARELGQDVLVVSKGLIEGTGAGHIREYPIRVVAFRTTCGS